MTTAALTQKFEGWFATSFWVDCHYGLAFVGTLIVFGIYLVTSRFDAGFSTFVGGMWITAVGNDKLNMPATPPAVG